MIIPSKIINVGDEVMLELTWELLTKLSWKVGDELNWTETPTGWSFELVVDESNESAVQLDMYDDVIDNTAKSVVQLDMYNDKDEKCQ